MSNRVRNTQACLGANFPSSQAAALEQTFGLNASAFKTANQSVVSSTTNVNDTELWIELPAGPSQIELYAQLTVGAAAGGFRGQLRFDEGAVGTINAYASLLNANTTGPEGGVILTAINGIVSTGTSQPLALIITGSVNLTSAGLVRFQWAQVGINAAATVVNAGSYFTSRQITR